MAAAVDTFEAYRVASNRAWRTYNDYSHGEATEAQVHRDQAVEHEAEKAHRTVLARLAAVPATVSCPPPRPPRSVPVTEAQGGGNTMPAGERCPIGPLNAHTYNYERTECIWCGPNALATKPGRWVSLDNGYSAWSATPPEDPS